MKTWKKEAFKKIMRKNKECGFSQMDSYYLAKRYVNNVFNNNNKRVCLK